MSYMPTLTTFTPCTKTDSQSTTVPVLQKPRLALPPEDANVSRAGAWRVTHLKYFECPVCTAHV